MTYVHQTTDPNPGGTSDAGKQGKQKKVTVVVSFSNCFVILIHLSFIWYHVKVTIYKFHLKGTLNLL